jgi:predicted anti-sigma-YlaC factor YlaD
MTTCKQIQRQLALLSVDALDQSEKAAALGHLQLCPDCKAYWEGLQTVVSLYTEDAERSIVSTAGLIAVRARAKRELFTWPRAAALAASIVILTAAIFLLRQEPQRPSEDIPAAFQSGTDSVLSIADSRRLLNKDLEALAEIAERYERREFVFSVGTRDEWP